jgi:cysteine synthase
MQLQARQREHPPVAGRSSAHDRISQRRGPPTGMPGLASAVCQERPQAFTHIADPDRLIASTLRRGGILNDQDWELIMVAMVAELIRTPFLRARRDVFLKCELLSPGRSHKARVARALINDAEARGWIEPGCNKVLLERSGGNLGIALAMESLARGYKLTLVTDPHYSATKKSIASALGAQVIDRGIEYPDCSSNGEVVDLLLAPQDAPYHYLNQFGNSANPRAHELGTGAEIVSDLIVRGYTRDVTVVLVTGMGTGASMQGISAALKGWFESVITIAVQPPNCDLLAGTYGEHPVQGISVGEAAPFAPADMLDGIVPVSTSQVSAAQEKLLRDHRLFVGPSSAANMAALTLARHHPACGSKPRIFVSILFDRGEDYL